MSKRHLGFGSSWKVDPIKIHGLLQHNDFEKMNVEERYYFISLLEEFTNFFFYFLAAL